MKISLIITHRILDDELMSLAKRCYEAVNKSYYPLETIFVDGNSNIGYIGWLEETPDIYIRNNYNVSYPRMWDMGIESSSGNIIILMDNNCMPLINDWDKEIIDKLTEFNIEFRGRRDGFCFAFKKETYDKFGPFLIEN